MACVWQLGEFTLQYVRFRTNLNSCGAARIAAGHSRSGRAYSSLSYFMKNLRDEGLIFNPQFLCLLLDTFQVIAIDSDIQDRVFFSLLDSRDDFFILAAADAFYGGVTASATLNPIQPGTTDAFVLWRRYCQCHAKSNPARYHQ